MSRHALPRSWPSSKVAARSYSAYAAPCPSISMRLQLRSEQRLGWDVWHFQHHLLTDQYSSWWVLEPICSTQRVNQLEFRSRSGGITMSVTDRGLYPIRLRYVVSGDPTVGTTCRLIATT